MYNVRNINSFIYSSPREEWLNQNGGRDENDVQIDTYGQEFVWMKNGSSDVREYLPLKMQSKKIRKIRKVPEKYNLLYTPKTPWY